MKNISDLLNRFQSVGANTIALKVFTSEIIEKHTGFKLETKNISINNGQIKIKANPNLKSEILIKKTPIIKEISQAVPKLKINNIV